VTWAMLARWRPTPDTRVLLVVAASLLARAGTAVGPAATVGAQGGAGPQLLHFPMRWCVLEGTVAARRDSDAAVLARIRRGSSILAPQTSITLRSVLSTTLADARACPVIKDPRTSLGRPGDVRTPAESSSEYLLVMQRCV
jgi:hypothetical protein